MGERKFDFRGSGFLWKTSNFLVPAVALAGFGVFAARAGFSLDIILVLAALSLVLLVCGAVPILRYFNEAILLEGSQLIYRDLFGRRRLSVPLYAIPAQRCTSLDASGTNERPWFKIVVHTSGGDIPIDSRMRGIDELLELLRKQGIERQKSTRFDYKNPFLVVLGYFLLAMAVVAATTIIWQRATTDMPYSVNGVRQSGPPPWVFILGFVTIWSGGFGAVGSYLVLRARNERIEIEGNRISWTDWLGRPRVVAYLSELMPGALNETRRSGSDGGTHYYYELSTSAGTIKFDQTIRHSRDLIDTIEEATKLRLPQGTAASSSDAR